MRAFILLAFLVGSVAAETPEPFPDRVTFTRAELETLQQELEAMVRKREDAAYQRGQSDVRQRCASLI